MRMSKKQKFAAVVLAIGIAATSMLLVYASGGPYHDVGPFNAHYDAIVYSFEQGYLEGLADEYFESDMALTRAEFVTLLGRAAERAGLKIPEATSARFSDVDPDSWCGKYVNWASRKGILSGAGGDSFDPQGVLSREEASALAVNFVETVRLEPQTNHKAKYKDLDQVSFWYEEEVNQAIAANLSLGYKSKQMEPGEPVTRGEMAGLIYTLDNLYLNGGLNLTEVLDIYVPIIPELPVNSYEKSAFTLDGHVKGYDHGGLKAIWGIDVSVHQGEIDWNQVRASGVEFAMVRVGGRGYGSGLVYDDDRFVENMEGAIGAGVKVGAYFFSQAISVEEVKEEAQFVVSRLRGYPVSYPVVFDWEEIGTAEARTDGVSPEELTEMAQVFCDMISDAGYTPMVYANRKLALLGYDLTGIQGYDFWLAEYNELPSYYYDFQMWQYTESGRVNGIKGNVDMNLSFVDYSAW